MSGRDAREFAEGIANYVQSHGRYTRLTKRQAMVEAVLVLINDIGAAQGYLQTIGIDVDLYGHADP